MFTMFHYFAFLSTSSVIIIISVIAVIVCEDLIEQIAEALAFILFLLLDFHFFYALWSLSFNPLHDNLLFLALFFYSASFE